jgi:hypothetical protein
MKWKKLIAWPVWLIGNTIQLLISLIIFLVILALVFQFGQWLCSIDKAKWIAFLIGLGKVVGCVGVFVGSLLLYVWSKEVLGKD